MIVAEYITALACLPDDWKAIPLHEFNIVRAGYNPVFMLCIAHPEKVPMTWRAEDGWQPIKFVYPEEGHA